MVGGPAHAKMLALGAVGPMPARRYILCLEPLGRRSPVPAAAPLPPHTAYKDFLGHWASSGRPSCRCCANSSVRTRGDAEFSSASAVDRR